MNLSALAIARPVTTTLLTLGLALAGAVAYFLLPVAPLPNVDLPTVVVEVEVPGASPEIMATSVAAPLERHLGKIADVEEMTSSSYRGYTRIALQFGLRRNIDGAARDVQAAINAARADLPSSLRSNPTYHKVNPADSPVLVLALTSPTRAVAQLYDAANTVLQQKFSQIHGIGQVTIGGSSRPAVRVELNPHALFRYGIGLEDVRAALSSANAHAPKGIIEDEHRRWQLYTNDQAAKADQYRSLIIAYRDGEAVRLSDVAEVIDSVENVRTQGVANGRPAVLLVLYRQPGANVVDTVERVYEVLPRLRASIASDIDVTVVSDRTITIRASLHEMERTLALFIGFVIFVALVFLRSVRSALIPTLTLLVSLLSTFGAMYLLGYSLNNVSLMALAVAAGLVVDDTIVVLENIARHVEAGVPRFEAALRGAQEVGATVLSMSLSVLALLIPILLMGGIVGRYFREFAVTLAVATIASLVISLTTTPMMCARVLDQTRVAGQNRLVRWSEHSFAVVLSGYSRSLEWSLCHGPLVLAILGVVFGLNFYLFSHAPKGFFPRQDTGRLTGWIEPDQSISFQLMRQKLTRIISVLNDDPAVESAAGYTWGYVFVMLKPASERDVSADEVIARLDEKLARLPGTTLHLQVAQDLIGGNIESNAQYQFAVLGDDLEQVHTWTPKIVEALKVESAITDVNPDQEQNGLERNITIDRATAARLGLSVSQIDNTLYDAFGQRQVSTIYGAFNQYAVVMEVAPQYWQNPEALTDLYVSTAGGPVSGTRATNAVVGTVGGTTAGKSSTTTARIAGDTERNLATNQIGNTGRNRASTGSAVSTSVEKMVPLAALAHFDSQKTSFGVYHEGPFVASTISFNLAPGQSLSDASEAISRVMTELRVPGSLHGKFQGTARLFEETLAREPILVLTAIVSVYIVLGILYESLIHPLTILSTLPSAGLGTVLALKALDTEFSVMALIGVILLIGIVAKNAIMMVDVAIDAERRRGLEPGEAIYHACVLRFRPIMMTTMAALFGALPLALGLGEGIELRHPLGISIVGGLIISQILTLYTTPVIYLYLNRFRSRAKGTAYTDHFSAVVREKQLEKTDA
ncbi:MAG TPA: efflux RND transporter permease subunit [Stellaceae bacterium]|nr:efflux RND transporter permease subunit [Stellaceae bacterium]